MDIFTAKGIVLGSLFLLTFVLSMLPLKLLKKLQNTVDPVKRAQIGRNISFLSCFAAGVFMATALLDLFPEVDEILGKAMIETLHTSFPVAEFSVAFGFFLVLIVEQIVLDYKETTLECSSVVMGDALSPDELDELRRTQRQGSVEGLSDHPQVPEFGHVHVDEAEAHSSFRSVLLLLALSLHSLFEGIAIGLQPNVQSVLQICLAVCLHKGIIAFSLGLNLVQSELKVGAIIRANVLFCLTTPLGIGLAMGLEEFGHTVASSLINGVLQGLACGTFLYITFFEVLPHELNHGGKRMLKLLALLAGFSFVCGILFLEPNKELGPSCTLP